MYNQILSKFCWVAIILEKGVALESDSAVNLPVELGRELISLIISISAPLILPVADIWIALSSDVSTIIPPILVLAYHFLVILL